MEKICKLSVENETLKKQLGTASEHAVQLLEAEKKIKELEDKIYSREAERRKLHNLVQELRGNVRVAVRVRPLLGNEPNEESNEFGAVKCDKHASFVTLQRSDPKKGYRHLNIYLSSIDQRMVVTMPSNLHVLSFLLLNYLRFPRI